MFSGWVDKLKAWVSGEAGEYDWDEAHAKYLSFLTPGPFQRAVAAGEVEIVREMLARGKKAHRMRLLATFTPKFTHLVPEELVPLIVDFSFHVGFYVSAAAVAALPRTAETNPNQED